MFHLTTWKVIFVLVLFCLRLWTKWRWKEHYKNWKETIMIKDRRREENFLIILLHLDTCRVLGSIFLKSFLSRTINKHRVPPLTSLPICLIKECFSPLPLGIYREGGRRWNGITLESFIVFIRNLFLKCIY